MSKNVPGLLVIMLFISSSFYLILHASATDSSMSTITLPSHNRVGQASSPEKIAWTDLVNTQQRGNLLEKVSGTDNWPDAGARSTQNLTADGYFEFTAHEIDKERYIGLSNDFAGTEWNTIDYAIHLTNYQSGDTSAAIVLENGLYKTEIGYTPGSVFRISVENGGVRYFINGNLFFSSTIKPVFPLTADVAFRSINATIGNAVIEASVAGPGNSIDKKPPAIQGLAISNLTSNSATIRYNTDEQAVTSVEYGLTASYGNVLSQRNLNRNHQFNLVGLPATSTIHFRILAADATGNTTVSPDQTLTTTAASDTAPPAIFDSGIINITSTGATIFWSTDEPATSVVEYGSTSGYGSIVSQTGLRTSHTILLSRLPADSVIHFIIKATDAAGNTAVSPDLTFMTLPENPDTLPPIISGVMAHNISRSGATVSWSTNELATSFVEYGTTIAYGSSIQLNTHRSRHGISISRLPGDTLIHFRVKSTDTGANTTVSPDHVFRTLAEGDSTPPVISIINATAITASGATITWSTNEQATSVVEYGTTVAYGTIVAVSALVTDHSLNLTGLPADTRIFYRVKSTDGSGNTVVSAGSTFLTLPLPDSTPPAITGVGASGITTSGATISWTTDEPATSVVEYGFDSSLGSIVTIDQLSTTHNVNLIGLASNSDYYYRVISEDAAGNIAISNNFVLKTQATAAGFNGITDYGTYPVPPPSALPPAGAIFVDPTFKTTLMRVTDDNDSANNHNMYSYWPSFNKNSSYLWVGIANTAFLYDFDPAGFNLSNKRPFFRNKPSGISPFIEDMNWSSLSNNLVFFHEPAGAKLWSYDVVSTAFTLIKDFNASLPGSNLNQMSKSDDDNVFAFTRKDSNYNILGYIVWRRDTDTLTRIDVSSLDEVQIDKTGRYLLIKTGISGPNAIEGQVLDLQTGSIENLMDGPPDFNPGHSDMGRGYVIGHDNWQNRSLRRNLASPHSYFVVFDWLNDWTQGYHISLLSETENWMLISSYGSGTPPDGPFHEEIFLVETGGTKQVRRLAHHHSIFRTYWDTPRANISRDGRFAVFTSNWGSLNRRDVFILKIPQ